MQNTVCSYQDFNRFLYDHTLHRGRKYFRRYCSQTFSTKQILKYYVKDGFKVNGKQRIIIPKEEKYIKF